ncbi:hypothetical protein GCM10009544_62260 [Streptomyces stramineus]|uniref:MbtH-like domain-containing protein n=1 Tax=Streptomyces stramineus TaxID=173861 RepID=A0ABN1BA58_9ACTN
MTETAPAQQTTEPTYHVVVNDEEQYSIWPTDQDMPAGWRATGTDGTKEECLSHIDEVWTDMRPRSLREAMLADEAAGDGATPPAPDPEPEGPGLVDRLCAGDHPVEVVLRPESTPAALREAVDRGYVFLRFTDTRGGTELGVRLDPAATSLDGGDLTAGTGHIEVAGVLSLDFEEVRCRARVDLADLTGRGGLERVTGA